MENSKASEMDALGRKKEELLAKVQRIAETCEGIENEANAAKVAELNKRQAELLAQQNGLRGKLSVLQGELSSISRRIQELSGSGVQKILEAIKNQRWYFFKNKPKVLMDKNTALLWANLDYFPGRKEGGYTPDGAASLLANTNAAEELGEGYNEWRVPTPEELWSLLKEKTFPFQEGGNWRIQNLCYWAVMYNGAISGKDLDASGARTHIYNGMAIGLLPCYHGLVPADYEINLAPSNTLFTETEKLQMTLDVFVQNGLLPIFQDEAITELYRQIYIDRPKLLKQLAEVEAQLAELQKKEVCLTADFSYKPLLAKYDVKAVDQSVIQYYEAVLSVTDTILEMLQEYETAQSETIRDFSKIALQLEARYTESPHLTEAENEHLAERQQFLAVHLELGMDAVKAQILNIQSQAEALAKRLREVTCRENSICELAAMEAEPRASFAFLVENMARIVKEAQQKVDFFALHRSFVTNLVNAWDEWSEDYRSFKTNKREELVAVCRDNAVEEEVYGAWYEDWENKRFLIEQRFLPLAEFALKGNLLSDEEITPAECVWKILKNYKNEIDDFYLGERKNIYQKFAFQAGGDLQDKFETENELYKLTERLQRSLSEIIFSRKKTEERMFLLRWSEPLLNVPIDEIVAFVNERELAAISAEVMEQFAALKRQNFAAYLSDSCAYSEALQKREKEYNALMFRMRKDLRKQ